MQRVLRPVLTFFVSGKDFTSIRRKHSLREKENPQRTLSRKCGISALLCCDREENDSTAAVQRLLILITCANTHAHFNKAVARMGTQLLSLALMQDRLKSERGRVHEPLGLTATSG